MVMNDAGIFVVYALLAAAAGLLLLYATVRTISEAWHGGRIAVETKAKRKGLL